MLICSHPIRLHARYDVYGRGQGDLAQFMKAQVVPELEDEHQDVNFELLSRNIASNAPVRSSGSSAKISGGSDQRQTAAMLKAPATNSPIAAAVSETHRLFLRCCCLCVKEADRWRQCCCVV